MNRKSSSQGQTPPKLIVQARPHPFSGAVLTLQQARELTPTMVLLVVQALAERILEGGPSASSAQQPNAADSPRSAFSTASGDAVLRPQRQKVQYTVWITQAWHVLKWGEPSACLFWEMCTMFHTLFLAEAAQEPARVAMQPRHARLYFPAFPAVEPSSSVDSQDAPRRERVGPASGRNTPDSPGDSSGASSPVSTRAKAVSSAAALHLQSHALPAGTAKELPIWMIGMFLLMHCEDQVFFRCLAGDHDRRFSASLGPQDTWSNHTTPIPSLSPDLWNINSTLSPRTRMHAGHITDATRCASFLLRHLRKFLLLSAVPHNAEALAALMKLSVASSLKDSDFLNPRSVRPGERMGIASPGHTQASKTAIPNTNSIQTSTPLLSQTRNPLPGHASSTNQNIPPTIHHSYDVISIQNQHQEEHADTGLHVRLSKDDLDRLHLILQAPLGGFIDDPPLDITEIIPHSASADLVAYGGVLLEDLENELKKHLVAEIVQYNQDTKDPALSQITNDFQSLSLADTLNPNDSNSSPTTSFSNLHRDETSPEALDGRSTRQPKSLRIYNCHHTTILRKSNSRKEKSSHPPSFSTYGDTQPMVSLSIPRASHASYALSGKLHDLTINACSDSHIYLLQSFEHVTISECTNCTIVIGAVAGLMHVLDCERTKITVAARRIVVNNCSDVLHYSFTPNKPLLVGDNRSCQFAPYNTYYEGLREDLLATALAAIKVHPHENDSSTSTMTVQHMVLSKNMWKIPEDLTKLEMTQAISQLSPTMSPSSLSGSLNSGMDGSRSSDDMMQTPIILPPNEFHILYVPVSAPSSVESSSIGLSDGMTGTEDSHTMAKCGDSPYCRFLADVLSLSPLRLPAEYERQAISKVEKVRALQQVILSLTLEQQVTLEDDLNRMFRDWLVNSGNLRQVLDLVHILK